ncbi:hypothetical protein BDW72DRAFT_181968 [Aspergillus terricola var. indicus]
MFQFQLGSVVVPSVFWLSLSPNTVLITARESMGSHVPSSRLTPTPTSASFS